MKIKRIINGQEIEIELTNEEVLMAVHDDKKWWGAVMWSDDDIADYLCDNSIEPTEESIAAIRNKVEFQIQDTMISAGYDLINYEIESMMRYMQLQSVSERISNNIFFEDDEED